MSDDDDHDEGDPETTLSIYDDETYRMAFARHLEVLREGPRDDVPGLLDPLKDLLDSIMWGLDRMWEPEAAVFLAAASAQIDALREMKRLLPSKRVLDEGRKRRGEILALRRIEARRRTSSSSQVKLELVR